MTTKRQVLAICTVLAALLAVPMMMGASDSDERGLEKMAELIERGKERQALRLIEELRERGDEHDEDFEGEHREEFAFFELVDRYLSFGERYSEFCKNSNAVAIVAVTSIKDMYGDDRRQAAEMLTELLNDTKPQPVRNAIRMSLKEIYEESDNRDKAVDQAVALVHENQ